MSLSFRASGSGTALEHRIALRDELDIPLFLSRAQGITALHLASYEGHTDICKLLLEAGARVDERDNEGRTALLFAVQENQLETIRLLVDFGADANRMTLDGRSPLRVALERTYAHYEPPAGSAAAAGGVAEREAERASYEHMVRLLARDGRADMNALDLEHRTTLYWAVLDGQAGAARLLLELGASAEVADAEGRTPLVIACWQGSEPLVAALLEFRAEPNAVDADRRSALQICVWQGHVGCARLLLAAGADVEHECNQGATSLCIASQEGHLDMVRLLLEYNANIHHRDQFGTQLHRTCTQLHSNY